MILLDEIEIVLITIDLFLELNSLSELGTHLKVYYIYLSTHTTIIDE